MNPEQRIRAGELFEEGHRQAEVARRLGISRTTAMEWHRLWKEAGMRGLRTSKRRGRRPSIDADEERQIRAALFQTPRESGVDADEWSLSAVSQLIEKRTGTRYHPRHIGRLVRRLGWFIPPFGRHGAEARCALTSVDLDGNPLMLVQRRSVERTGIDRSDSDP